jgi:spore germination protein
MLTDPTARATAVRAIAALVRRDGYQEVNIDFELLKPSTRQGLVAFIRGLRAALPQGVTLSESVFPKVGVTSDINGAYNYIELAKYVDYLVIMLYDHHSDGGPAGPVSPYGWVAQNMNWFLHTAKIPANKLVIAAGVYGYDWPVGSTTAQEMPLTEINARLKASGARRQVDPGSENPFFRYTAGDGTQHVVWYQDSSTVLQRLQMAQKLGVRGIAIWALGEETPAVWGVIEQTWGGRSAG